MCVFTCQIYKSVWYLRWFCCMSAERDMASQSTSPLTGAAHRMPHPQTLSLKPLSEHKGRTLLTELAMATETGAAQTSEPGDVLCLIAALHDRLARISCADTVHGELWQSRYRNGITYSPALLPSPPNQSHAIVSPMQMSCLDP